jgi:hypothetical protein
MSGIGPNPLNAISKVYLNQIAEKKKDDTYLEPDMKKRQANNEKARKDMEKMGTSMKNPHFEETQVVEKLDPVGQEDADIDNDGDTDKTDKYLHKRRKAIGKAIKKRMKEETELSEIHSQAHKPHEVPTGDVKKLAAKAVKRYDADNDGDVDKKDASEKGMGEFVPSADGKKKVRTKAKFESYSWRQDITEIMTDDIDSKPIKEKKVNNKIKINPKLGESVENLGGELIEMVEIVDILAEITDQELRFVSDKMIDEVVEEFFAEALEEGDDIDLLQDTLCESIEMSINILLEQDAGAEARKRLTGGSPSRASVLDRVKSAVKKGAKVARKAVVKGAEYAGKAAGHAKNLAKDVGSAAKKGYQSTQSGSSSSSSSDSGDSSSSSSSSSERKGPGLLSRIGSKLKSGLKKAVGKGARALSRGARNVARRMNEDASMSPQELSLQKKKANIDKMIANKRNQELGKQTTEAPAKAMGEATEDSLRDRRMERGGVDGNTRYDRPPAKKATNAELGIKPGKTALQKELEKKHGKGKSAMDIVKAEIRAKHGKGAIMDTKKK